MSQKRKPWGWHTRYRGHKDDVPYIPDFLRWWRSRARKRKLAAAISVRVKLR